MKPFLHFAKVALGFILLFVGLYLLWVFSDRQVHADPFAVIFAVVAAIGAAILWHDRRAKDSK